MDADKRIIEIIEDDQGEGFRDPLVVDDLYLRIELERKLAWRKKLKAWRREEKGRS